MAATPKPLRKEIKKRVSSTKEVYRSADAKKAGFHKSEIKNMKKEDKKDVKRIVKAGH